MQNKYYTPDLEEFHIGFEYEFLEQHGSPDERWVKKILTQISDYEDDPYLGDTFTALERYNCVYVRNAWRVKYLDIEDLESLGWDCLTEFPNDFNSGFFSKGNFTLAINFNKFHLEINNNLINYRCLFQGIKNKSEFKQLMKFLNI